MSDLFFNRLMVAADNLREIAFWRQTAQTRAAVDELTMRQQRLLRLIFNRTAEQPEGVSLKSLADAQGLSSSAVSVMVENLVQRSILERVPCEADRRMVLIRIGEAGWEIVRRYQEIFDELSDNFLSELSPAEREIFILQMERLCDYSADVRKGTR